MQTVPKYLPISFCEFQAVKFSQSWEIYQCTRKRQGCTRNQRTSGRGSPPDGSIRLWACGTLRTADWYNERLNLCGGERARVVKCLPASTCHRGLGLLRGRQSQDPRHLHQLILLLTLLQKSSWILSFKVVLPRVNHNVPEGLPSAYSHPLLLVDCRSPWQP